MQRKIKYAKEEKENVIQHKVEQGKDWTQRNEDRGLLKQFTNNHINMYILRGSEEETRAKENLQKKLVKTLKHQIFQQNLKAF